MDHGANGQRLFCENMEQQAAIRRRNRTIIAAAAALILIIFIVLLVLMTIAFVRLGQQKCLPTKPYYVIMLDWSRSYDDSLSDSQAPNFVRYKSEYETNLTAAVNAAGYSDYSIDVFEFRDSDPTTYTKAHALGFFVYFTVVIEDSSPPPDAALLNALRTAIKQLQYPWQFTDISDNAIILCEKKHVSPASPAPETSGRGAASGETIDTEPTEPSTTPAPPPPSDVCIDIMFILDESEPLITIHDGHAFDDLKQYLIDLASYFNYTIGPAKTRFAVTGFGTVATLQLSFDDYTNGLELQQALSNLQLLSEIDPEDGARNTSGGLTLAHQYLNQSQRFNTNQVAVLIAYFEHDKGDDPKSAADSIRADGIPLYVVAIKDGDYVPVYENEMEEIAGDPSYLFPVEYYTDLWTDVFTSELIARAISDSNCASPRCLADVVYLIDQSTSITSDTYYTAVIPFMVNLTDALQISASSSHLAMVEFSSPNQTDVAFYLDTSYDPEYLKNLISSSPYVGGTTAMEKALNLTYFDVLTTEHGSRLNYTNVTTIAIIITDGVPTDTQPEGSAPNDAVKRLINEGVAIFSVGTGTLRPGYLFELTGNHTDSDGQPDRVFEVSDFSKLYMILQNLTSATACVPQPTTFCSSTFDVIYVVEDSPRADDIRVESFLNYITSGLNMYGGARVGMQLYNENSEVQFQLNTYDTVDEVIAAVQNAHFTKNDTNGPYTGRALEYTLDQMLTDANGERSCIPDIVIVLSYSKSADSADFVARKLRYQGALIVTVAQGNDASADLSQIASPGFYFQVDQSSGLSYELADTIVSQFCNYTPEPLYPCEMSSVQADIVFIVDVSDALDESASTAIYQYIINYLEPYRSSYGATGVQAALVTFEADVTASIHFNDSIDLQSFEDQLNEKWPKTEGGPNRGIANALRAVLNDIFKPENGYRRDAPHIALLFSLDCYTDNDDPASEAQLLRQQTEFFVVSVHPPTVDTQLLLELAGDTDRVFQLSTATEDGLPSFMPMVSWQFTCDAWSGTFAINFISDVDWDPDFAIDGSTQRLNEIQIIHDQLNDAYTNSALYALVVDVVDLKETPAGAKTQMISKVIFDGYTRLLSSTIVAAATQREFGDRGWSSIEVKDFAPRPLI